MPVLLISTCTPHGISHMIRMCAAKLLSPMLRDLLHAYRSRGTTKQLLSSSGITSGKPLRLGLATTASIYEQSGL